MSKLRVLVADDDEMVRVFLERLLKRRGDTCVMAHNGPQALTILQEQDFDVLITDLYMPEMNGLELVARARSLRPRLVPIVLTGMGTREDSIAAIKEGVFDFVEKPVRDITAFSLAIDRAGERARLTRERDELLASLQRQNERLETNLRILNEAYEKLMRQEEALEEDLRGAQRVQQSLLPKEFPRVGGLDFYGYYWPCERLGGDFFGIVPLDTDRAAVYLADVAGHGVRAALVTVVIRELLHAERLLRPASAILADPAQALGFLNRGLLEESDKRPLHVTMTYAVIDGRTGRIVYGNAGHPQPVLLGKHARGALPPAEGPALGIAPDAVFKTATERLEVGDALLMYSDGVSEARNPAGSELTAPRLEGALGNVLGQPSRSIGEHLERALLEHQQWTAPADDVSFVVIGRVAPDPAANGEPIPGSVKIIDTVSARSTAPPPPAAVEGGSADGEWIVRLVGRATWRQGVAMRAMVTEARGVGARAIYLDLAQCESLDSTMLGMMLEFRDDVTIVDPSTRVARQFIELGIFSRLRITRQQLPAIATEWKPDRPVSEMERALMILSAHEALAQSSPENLKRFGLVVEMLQKDQALKPAPSPAETTSPVETGKNK